MAPAPISVLAGTAPTPLAFALNGTGEMVLQSVTATIDGTGAGGTFDAVLSLYSQDGRLLSRTKPAASLAVGEQAVVTWAPFLRKPAAAAAAGALKACRLWTSNMALTIGNNNSGRLSFNNVSSFDSSVFGTTLSGGRVIRVSYKVKGWYAAYGQFVFTAQPATGSTGVIFVYVGDTLGQSGADYVNDGIGVNAGPYFAYSVTRYFPDELDALPGVSELWVSNLSAASRTIDQAFWQHVYLGDSDF